MVKQLPALVCDYRGSSKHNGAAQEEIHRKMHTGSQCISADPKWHISCHLPCSAWLPHLQICPTKPAEHSDGDCEEGPAGRIPTFVPVLFATWIQHDRTEKSRLWVFGQLFLGDDRYEVQRHWMGREKWNAHSRRFDHRQILSTFIFSQQFQNY